MWSNNWKLEDYAKHYVDVLSKPPNAWGQHISPIFGSTDILLNKMYREFGKAPTTDAIMAAFRARYPTSGVMEKYGTHSSNA